MTTAPAPAWLTAYREGRTGQPAAQPLNQREQPPTPRPAPAPPAAPAQASVRRVVNSQGFSEPQQWQFDGFERREPVLDTDHNPPRVVRQVGWQRCMRCRKPFFSEDVVGQRLCGGLDGGCRTEGGRRPEIRSRTR